MTYGMSNLYADEEAFGAEYSGFGYEMTIRLKEERAEDCLWAMDMIAIPCANPGRACSPGE